MRMLSTYLKEGLLNHVWRGSALTQPTTIYVSFHTGEPGDAGASEVDGSNWTDYARVGVTANTTEWSAPAATGDAHFIENNNQISWGSVTISGTQATLQGWGHWDASSGGNFLAGGFLGTGFVNAFARAADDTFYSFGHGFSDDDLVILVNPGTLPTGFSEGTEYHVVNATSNSFQLADSQGGAAKTVDVDWSGQAGLSQFIDLVDGQTLYIAAGGGDVVVS